MSKGNPETLIFAHNLKSVLEELGKKRLLQELGKMLLIRNFEIRAESAYLQGKIGGFFHSYIGQEAIQTAAVAAMGIEQWWTTTYRCHALALLTGATPNSLMAELYGKKNGNALGRGGSMHFFSKTMLGGHGIVGGQIPIGTGAGFAIRYKKEHPCLKDDNKEVSITFMGDGAVPQGAFHESLNLASLMNLPCIYVIENNQWGMGTEVERSVCVQPIAEKKAPGYAMKSYTFDGMDFFNCYAGFKHIFEEVKRDSRPILVEVLTDRFKGHSVSDPGLYRTKEDLSKCMERDPIQILFEVLVSNEFIDEQKFKALDKEKKDLVIACMKHADESPWPDPIQLEEDVFAD